MQLGSNPNSADSDGNGVSDLVEYRTKGKPCDDAACKAANRDQYAICSGYSPVTNANGSISFSNSSKDGLNDCEKFLLGGTVGNFNTNGDLIPDLLAFQNTLPILPGTANTAFADPFGDGLTNYDKLKLGLPIQVSKSILLNTHTRTTTFDFDGQPSADVSCYHMTVSGIALSSSNNIIKISLVQNGATLQDKPFLLYAEKPIGGGTSVTFQPSDFH